MRMLVIEDDPAIALEIERNLRSKGQRKQRPPKMPIRPHPLQQSSAHKQNNKFA